MSIDIWTDYLSTLDRHVDRVSTTLDRYVGRVSIAGIDCHSTAGAFSTHDPENPSQFNRQSYLQTNGSAIGTKMAVALANILWLRSKCKS